MAWSIELRASELTMASQCFQNRVAEKQNGFSQTLPLTQNEEALKKCAQDYLARVKQEEQRYQALKVHAEEKIDK